MTSAASVSVAPADVSVPDPLAPRTRLRLVESHVHEWSLRETEYEDGGRILRRLECTCGAVDFV